MEGQDRLAVDESRPLDRDTLVIVQERVGALAVDMAFDAADTDGMSRVQKARQIGYNQGQTDTMRDLDQLISDLLAAVRD